MSILIGAIADDFTGASDLANTLAKGGMRTVQTVGVPQAPLPAGTQAVVVALKTRSVPVAEAVAKSLAAYDWLAQQGTRQVIFKYCSTFDSTKEGNIGPVAEALLERTGAEVAVVCPAFPTNKRTIYQGHLFVGDRLLNESGMEKHPLTPMTDPDLRRWLSYQTKVPVGLVPFEAVRRGTGAIKAALAAEAAAGRRLAVVDALGDEDLFAIGAALDGARLVTGGSGIALGLPENFRKAGALGGGAGAFAPIGGPAVALSGSCSIASRRQLAEHGKAHPVLRVDTDALIAGTQTAEGMLQDVMRVLDRRPIVASTDEPEAVAAAQARHGRDKAAHAVERFFGELAQRLAAAGVTRIVVGGGETSGAVVEALASDVLEIGPEIDPGVPAIAASVNGQRIGLALKSGNFGAPDFYEKAFGVLERGAA